VSPARNTHGFLKTHEKALEKVVVKIVEVRENSTENTHRLSNTLGNAPKKAVVEDVEVEVAEGVRGLVDEQQHEVRLGRSRVRHLRDRLQRTRMRNDQ
jgi:hypothetical protein